MESRLKQLKRKLFSQKTQIKNPDLLQPLLAGVEDVELDTFRTNQPKEEFTEQVELQPEMKDRGLSTDYALIHANRVPSHAEVKEFLDEHNEKPHWRLTRIGLCLVLLLGGSTADTWQFYDGMKDITDRVLGIFENSPTVTWIVVVAYLLQDITINRKFTNDGLDQVIRIAQGEKAPDWEELPPAEEKKARIFSFCTNAYAIFSDMIANAYALAKSGFANDAVCFIFGAISSLSNLPTEGVQNYFLMRSLYTRTSKALENALKEMELNERFKEKPTVFKKGFPLVWGELSVYLKIALQHPDNKELLNKPGKNLSAHLLNLFNLKDKEAVNNYLVHDLKFDPFVAECLAVKIANLNAPADAKQEAAPQSHAKDFLFKILQIIERLFKLSLKIFGASQDMISSYVSVAAMFAVSSPFLSFFLFVMSLANGLNDACFGGEMSTQAIDAFKASLQKGVGKQDALIFFLSLFFAGMVGHAQLKFIMDMLRDPDAPLPAPIAALMTSSVSTLLATGAACREGINYCYYFYPIFETIVIELANLQRQREYQHGLREHFYLAKFDTLDEGWLAVSALSMEKHPPKLLQDAKEAKLEENYFAKEKAYRQVKDPGPAPKPQAPEGPAQQCMDVQVCEDDECDDAMYAEAKTASSLPPPGLLGKMNFITAATTRAGALATTTAQALGMSLASTSKPADKLSTPPAPNAAP